MSFQWLSEGLNSCSGQAPCMAQGLEMVQFVEGQNVSDLIQHSTRMSPCVISGNNITYNNTKITYNKEISKHTKIIFDNNWTWTNNILISTERGNGSTGRMNDGKSQGNQIVFKQKSIQVYIDVKEWV